MKNDAIIVDIDGTIANIEHRLKHIRKKPKDWKKFYENMKADKPKHNVITILQKLNEDYYLIFVTGRPEEYRNVTLTWLNRNMQTCVMEDMLHMREDEDYRQDDIIKKEIFINEIEPKYEVIAVFEDRPRVIKMWRDLGLECFKVGEWNE